jgi:hypothetical protein
MIKDKVILVSMAAGVVALLIGVFSHFARCTALVTSATWHDLAQSCLLFAIAWGIGKLVPSGLAKP